MRQLLLMIACAVAILSAAAAHAAATIPDVKTLKELRAAPLHTLADGTELRLGLSDGGEAAGPWGVLYCLVEKEPAGGTPATARATTQRAGRERLGPLSYDVNWTGPKKLQLVEHRDRWRRDSGYPIVYAGRVLLNHKDVATVSVFAPDGELLAERKVEVNEPRPAWWVTFARPREIRRGEAPVDGFVALDEVSPAAPEFGHAGGSIATSQPATTAAIANDVDLPLPGMLAADVKDDALLRLSLEPEGFVVRVNAKRRPHVAPDDMLARWWVNGEPRALQNWRHDARQYMQRQQRVVDRATADFALPDFLGDLKPGDRVGLQLLWCPDGHAPVPGPHAMEQLRQRVMRMNVRGWEWPLLTNRIEFELTAELLAKRDAPLPKADNE